MYFTLEPTAKNFSDYPGKPVFGASLERLGAAGSAAAGAAGLPGYSAGGAPKAAPGQWRGGT